MKTQKNSGADRSSKNTDSKKSSSSKSTTKDLKNDDLKKVRGGAGVLSGGNDLSNMIGGSVGISNSSSGSDGTHTYSSQDSHNANLGLGNQLDNLNF